MLRREVLVDDVKQLQFLNDILLDPHNFSKIDKEGSESIGVRGEDLGHVALLSNLVEIIPVEVMEFVHEVIHFGH